MSIYDLLSAAMNSRADTIPGKVASEFYEIDDPAGGYVWGCDIDIGQPMVYTDEHGREQTTTVLRNVPIAFNNREIFYAQVGWPVLLRQITTSRYAVVGLGKSIKVTTDITYVRFTDEAVTITGRQTTGWYYRRLTLGEMGSLDSFGSLPFGATGIFKASDNTFVRIVS